MKVERICPEGPALSRIVGGAWRWNHLPAAELNRLIHTALDLGITTFDHADIYGDYSNEEIFGSALGNDTALKQRMQIVTKCGIKLLSGKKPEHRVKHYDTSYHHIITSAENSLSLLGIEKIDLLLIHRPDPLMDVREAARAFEKLKTEGKVLYFGVSNFTNSQFDLLQSTLPFPLVTNQIEVSLLRHEAFFDGTVDHLYAKGISPMAWSPLGGGKLLNNTTEHGKKIQEQSNGLLEKYQASLSQLLLAWLLKHPANLFPVVGTGNSARMEEAVKALALSLDQQDWFEMLKWIRGADVP